MRNRYTLALVLVLMMANVMAQVHVKGNRFVDLALGPVDGFTFKPTIDNSGYWLSLGTGKYNKQENSWRWIGTFLQKNYAITGGPSGMSTIPVRQYSLSFGYGYALFISKRRAIYGNVVPQILVGYESINNNQPEIGNYQIGNQSGFRMGGKVGVELEVENFFIVAAQQWIPGSSTKIFHTQIGVGCRINR